MIASTQTNHPLAGVSAGAEVQARVKEACAQLKIAGLRITQPRVAILTALAARRHPASIDQLHRDLSNTSCDLVTVYRCLAAFEDIGLVRRSFFHNGTSLYEISLNKHSSRYHVVCKSTRTVEEIDPSTTAALEQAVQKIEELLRERGYKGVTHVVEFFGIAPAPNRLAAAAPLVPAVR
ncbi:transcriptional repressor [Horticoccus luteus]|uniref:Transcriptional repressor n=1 Tax=Horticoccus luteus TaxID=2862869 RepID=A0A8F9TUL5_9BACT|nr:Fur family transcriptional regulator [Horticoccus luteus]QYM78410.1 transcriptional repressor [Horticoccus luteus]